jgi:DNA-binding NarL/FixJ family response regulator
MVFGSPETPDSPISVCVAGRNRLLCEALVRLLKNRAGFSVQSLSRGSADDLQSHEQTHFNVLLTDSLTWFSELGAANEGDARNPFEHILFFGMEPDPEQFIEAIRSGASGYLLNDASSDDLVRAVRMVARGEAVCPPQLCKFLFQRVREISDLVPVRRKSRDRRAWNLTMRQRQLMDLVSKGLSNKEIAVQRNLSQFTVKNHIRRVLRHVEAQSRHEAVDVIRAGGVLPLA